MADIILGERTKKIFRILLKMGYAKLGKDLKMIGNDLKYDQNLVIRNLNAVLVLGASHLHQRDNWQRNMMLGYGQALLWTIQKDTAYRDVFFWTLNEMLKHADEFIELLKPYVKPPEEWTPNMWEDSRKKTERLQKEGKLPKNTKCLEETIYTPSTQNKRHQKYMKKLK